MAAGADGTVWDVRSQANAPELRQIERFVPVDVNAKRTIQRIVGVARRGIAQSLH
ncbi:hypothetical protein GCM10008019_35850 [Deinococcus soli (ex Cha et al. 2016)]|nr:hypothetical protein GCM10008019_35850 [Deinococcus soli (ex Cha et al. 2016)]